MKKLLTIIILSLMWNEYSFAKGDKEFFITCSAKGIYKMSYNQSRSVKTVFDEYKIVIGKGELFVMGDNRKISIDSRKFGPIKIKNILSFYRF